MGRKLSYCVLLKVLIKDECECLPDDYFDNFVIEREKEIKRHVIENIGINGDTLEKSSETDEKLVLDPIVRHLFYYSGI